MVDLLESPLTLKARRDNVLDQMDAGTYAIMDGAKSNTRNSDVSNTFRQESSFYYLTGHDNAGARLALFKDNGESILFVSRYSPNLAVWVGNQPSYEEIKEATGVDRVVDVKSFNLIMDDNRPLTKGRTKTDISDIVKELRVFKSDDEIEKHREAANITAKAFDSALRGFSPDMTEFQAAMLIEYAFNQKGSIRTCFPTIVASGANGLVLHYPQEMQYSNMKKLAEGDLVLVDFGAEFGYRGADVSRTFPVGKEFTTEQRVVYDIVLQVQNNCIDRCVAGTASNDLYMFSLEKLTEGLLSEGIITGNYSTQEVIGRGLHQFFYPHGLGHMLGMDVHDVGRITEEVGKDIGKPSFDDPFRYYLRDRILREGMVTTIEPGVYVNDHPMFDPRFVGIAVRIEDDIQILAKGNENLTSAIPKEPEKLMEMRAQAYDNSFKLENS